MKRSNRILALVMCIFSLIVLSVPAFAADNNDDHNLLIQYKYKDTPIEGAKFELYLIAVENGGEYKLSQSFAASGINIELDNADKRNSAALALKAYAFDKAIVPAYIGTTDSNGELFIDPIEPGMYLFTAYKRTVDGSTYTSAPFIGVIGDTEGNAVIAVPKTQRAEKTEETMSLRTLKVWSDRGYESARPDNITVKLMCDGKLYDTVKLSKKNNWAYTWDSLDADCDWCVTEIIPAGYTESVELIGNTFVITNKIKTESPSSPSGDDSGGGNGGKKLPQTGQLWWPVPVMLCAGLLLVVCGVVRRKEND